MSDTNPPQTSRSDDDDAQLAVDQRPVLHIGGLVVSVQTLQLGIAFVLSLFVLIGCFWVLLAPTDERSEQAAIALSTAVVTAWITRLGGQLIGRR